jgi:murein DD-endopeptidase MepM/ murein hydrolase activator NlpD
MNLRLDLLSLYASWRWLAVAGAVIAVAAVGLFVAMAAPFGRGNAQQALLEASKRAEHEAFTGALVNREEESLSVARGESLALVLSRANVGWEEIDSAMTAVSAVYNARDMRAGQQVDIYYRPSGDKSQLLGLAFRTNPGAAVTVARNPDGAFWAREIITPWSMQTTHVTTSINGSIYQSALVAGATEKEVAVISNVFAYDVDFQRDVFPGDKFEMLFDRYFDEDGRTVRTGNVYFISLGTRRGVKSYYYFQGPEDRDGAWYDASGRSARKFLMRTPVDGARLSSSFGMRLHPILGYSRLHKGVDFAAGAGTPIKAAGDGVIVKAGGFGSYGNYVRIRHADRYETAYGHLSRFAPGLRNGVSVRQGQVIGYVGSTGAATGPHLHYEVLYKTTQVNPISLKLATGRNLDANDLVLFEKERARIDALRAQGSSSPALIATASASAIKPDLRGGLE